MPARNRRRINPVHRHSPPPAARHRWTGSTGGGRGRPPPAGVLRRDGPAPRRRGSLPVAAGSVRIRDTLIDLPMPRALEVLDRVLQRLEQGELSALDAIDQLLFE